jgi:hypothetical protein
VSGSTRSRLRELRQQVLELAEAHGIEVLNGSGRGRAYRGAPTKGRAARIRVPEIRGQVSYFVALHELGHLVARGNRSLPQLEAEAQAWRWALDHALVEPTETTRARIRTYLRSYYERAVVRRVLGRRVVAAIPPAGSAYWTLLAQLGDPDPRPGPVQIQVVRKGRAGRKRRTFGTKLRRRSA